MMLVAVRTSVLIIMMILMIDDDRGGGGGRGGGCCRNGRTSTYNGSRQIMAIWKPSMWTVMRYGCQRYRNLPRELLKYMCFQLTPYLPPTRSLQLFLLQHTIF